MVEKADNFVLSFKDLARVGHVTRWHSVRVGRQQTLAEHHYLVAMLTNKLAKDILNVSDSERLNMVEYAMWHDLPEILLGDLPSPLKRRVAQLCSGGPNPLDILEQQAAPWLFNQKKKLQEKPEQAIIVKLADLIDAIVFIEQEGMGNHSATVAVQLREVFNEKVGEAQKNHSGLPWEKAMALLSELVSANDANKIAFEQG